MTRSWRAVTRRLFSVLVTMVVVVASAAAAGLFSCNAPFIPVPPPDNVFVAQSLTDTGGNTKTVWIAYGKADPHAALAKFFIFNETIGSGVIVDANADGTYMAPALDGTRGDRITLYYTTPEGGGSTAVCRQLVETDPAPPCP